MVLLFTEGIRDAAANLQVMPSRVRATAPSLVLVLVVLASGGPSTADEHPPLTPVTEPTYSVTPTVRAWVPTRHGDIAVDLTTPALDPQERVPVIMAMSPYVATFPPSLSSTWVRRGYATAVAQVLGTADSGGCWDYGGRREREAAADVVEWLAGFALDGSPSPAASWSNGKVGMIGASYDGTIANAAAAEAPPHLETIVPELAISDWYGYSYHDGVRYFMMDPAQRQGLVIDEQGFDTPLVFDTAFAIAPTRNRDAGFEQRLLARACPGVLDKLEHTARAYDLDPDYDAFWRERSYRADAQAVADADISVLVVGGWRDYNVKHSESTRWFEAIPVDDPATEADEGSPFTMMLMSQQAHGLPDAGFGYDVILHAWFDHFLYGHETNITAQPRVWTRGNDGTLRFEADWPPPAAAQVHLPLDGLPTGEPPGAGTTIADTGAMTESLALAVRGGEAVAWFETLPLETDLRIAGTPALDLFASTLGTSTQFTPVLFDLGPSGDPSDPRCAFAPPQEACVISRGFLNARHRMGIEHGEDLTPGETYRATVRFLGADWIVPAGHRIGVAVMASNAWWALADQQRVRTTILHDAAHASALLLPVVGGAAAADAAGL